MDARGGASGESRGMNGRARFSVFVVRVGSGFGVGAAHLLLDVLPVFANPLVNAFRGVDPVPSRRG